MGCYVCEFPRLPSESDLLACFPSLEQYISHLVKSDSGLQDAIFKYQELRCAGWLGQLVMDSFTTFLCSKLSHICIDAGESLIHDYFMSLFSAYGGLVYIVMIVRCLNGILDLVRNSPKLELLLYLLNILIKKSKNLTIRLNNCSNASVTDSLKYKLLKRK